MTYENPSAVGAQLRDWMSAHGLSEEGLAALVSADPNGVAVSQSWISRICTGDFRRTSGKAGVVLRYAGIIPMAKPIADERGKRLLAAALNEVWDGTLPSAVAIAAVLRGVGQVARKSPR